MLLLTAPYVATSRTVTVVLREKEKKIITPTRVVVQVPSSDNAATSCLVFLLEQEPDQSWLEGLSVYENWGQEEYNKWLRETEGRGDESGLIAHIHFSKQTWVDINCMRSSGIRTSPDF